MTDAKIRLALFYLYLREAYTRRKQMTFKNYDDFVGLLETCNFKVAEADFSKPVETPFIAYFKDEDKNVYADGKVIFTLYSKIDIELYTDRTDHASEGKFAEWLNSNNLVWKKTNRAWIAAEKMCVSYYEVRVDYKI